VVYQQNENVFEEDIKLLKLDVVLRDNALVDLRKKFKKAEQERDDTVFDGDELISSESDISMPTSSVHDRHVVPTIVLTRSRLVPLTAARPVTIVVPQTKVQHQRPTQNGVNKAHSPIRRKLGNPQHALKDKGVIDSGCLRYMTGNISYLSDFEEINGGYVAFNGNPKGGKIRVMVPRENNMYNVDLKNIVPLGDLTCHFVKATLDESNL
nr:hypothetical protein [Tanacetum cinerariifolium]